GSRKKKRRKIHREQGEENGNRGEKNNKTCNQSRTYLATRSACSRLLSSVALVPPVTGTTVHPQSFMPHIFGSSHTAQRFLSCRCSNPTNPQLGSGLFLLLRNANPS
ncbi:unnamed protein product, partial [Pylaiella littoralis]